MEEPNASSADASDIEEEEEEEAATAAAAMARAMSGPTAADAAIRSAVGAFLIFFFLLWPCCTDA